MYEETLALREREISSDLKMLNYNSACLITPSYDSRGDNIPFSRSHIDMKLRVKKGILNKTDHFQSVYVDLSSILFDLSETEPYFISMQTLAFSLLFLARIDTLFEN